jgi:tripartite ATP-independent transporter DctM subunit
MRAAAVIPEGSPAASTPAAGAEKGPLTVILEGLCAMLVLSEAGLLLIGVISRFLFHLPVIWIDELASTLFVWMAMLGSALAMQRGKHMRLTVLLDRWSKPLQEVLQSIALLVTVLFLGAALPSSITYAVHEVPLLTPALEWTAAVRSAAIPVGLGMMLLYAAGLLIHHRLKPLALGTLVVLGPTLLLLLVKSDLQALGQMNLVIFFVILLFGAVLAGIPIAFAFGLSTISYLGLVADTPLLVVSSRMEEGVSSLILLAVPLFVFLGALLEITGMASRMIQFLVSVLGHVRGGLNYVLLAGMYLVSGISGSKAADMAAITPVLFPEMRRRGGDEGDMVALLAASGAMSETIPPSIVLITIGSVVGISISALFTAGIVPALFLALALAGYSWCRARKSQAPRTPRPPVEVIRRSLLVATPALLLPFAIRGTVVEGVATATEVSTVGILYVVVIGLIVERRLDPRRVYGALVDTAAMAGMILLIVGTATGMSWALTISGLAADVSAIMKSMPGGSLGFMMISIVAFIILGSILEGIPATVVFGPLLFPVARRLGIADVHYAVVVVLAMGIGLFSPPFGVGYYTACAIGNIDPAKGIRRIWPYMAVLLIGTLVVAVVPWFALGFLP